jgi:hypothetical protein
MAESGASGISGFDVESRCPALIGVEELLALAEQLDLSLRVDGFAPGLIDAGKYVMRLGVVPIESYGSLQFA